MTLPFLRPGARVLVASTAMSLAIAAVGGCSSGHAGTVKNSTLMVAAFNPFTGPDASFGPEMVAGCQAAATAINAAGGVLSNQVQCTSVDTRGDPADAVTGATKMLASTSNLIDVLGPSSNEADATAPLIDAAKVPMFADTGQASFDHTNLKYFWRLLPADDVRGYAMATYAKRKGYLRGAVVFGNDIGAQAGLPTLLKAYSAVGGNMVLNQKIALGQSDYRSEVEKLIAANPQVIFTEASPQANATYLSELKQLGHLIPIIGTDATIQPAWLSAVSGAIGQSDLSRFFVAEQPYAPATGPSWKAYNKSLLASKSVSKPAQWSTDSYTMTDYDAVIVTALAALSANSTDPSVFNAAIPTVTTPGPGKVVVHSFAEGMAALKAGKKISYSGAAGVINFNQWHSSTGGFEIASYQPNGQLAVTDTITATDLEQLMK